MIYVVRADSYINDLLTVWDYIAESSPDAADRMIKRLEARADSLAMSPEIGERQPQFGDNIRRVIEGQFLLIYSVAENRIDILRAVHGSKKMEELFD